MRSHRFVADVNIEKVIVDYLRSNGHDVKWIPDYDCKMKDVDLLKLAVKEKRILLTNDKDFGELAFLQKSLKTGVVLLRVRGQNVRDNVKLLKKLLSRYGERLAGQFVVITRGEIRIIRMEERN